MCVFVLGEFARIESEYEGKGDFFIFCFLLCGKLQAQKTGMEGRRDEWDRVHTVKFTMNQ